AVAGPFDAGAHRGVDGGGVVAVDEQRRDPVADPLRGERGCGGLLGQRRADRVAVVLYQEHHWRFPYAGEVERLMGVALAGGAVAEQRERDLVLLLEPRGISEADRVQGIGGERSALRRD